MSPGKRARLCFDHVSFASRRLKSAWAQVKRVGNGLRQMKINLAGRSSSDHDECEPYHRGSACFLCRKPEKSMVICEPQVSTRQIYLFPGKAPATD